MNSMENVSSTVAMKHLDAITTLCNTIRNNLSFALEISGDTVGNYSGGIIGNMNDEYIDLILKALILIKYHLFEIKQHLDDFHEKDDLSKIFIGIQNTIDQLNTIRIQSGFIQIEFSFLIEEIQNYAKDILENFSIYA